MINNKNFNNIFISDKALQKAEHDQFDHYNYSVLLEKIVNEQPTPMNIGIFGKWGVGKSTIVNLLKELLASKIKKKKVIFIEFKVWKYSEKSLRRKFITNIANKLNYDIDSVYSKIYTDQEFEYVNLNLKEIVRTIFSIKSISLWILIISLFFFALFRIFNLIEFNYQILNEISVKVENFITIPILISTFTWLFEIIKKAKMKIKTAKFDSEEQFENEFIKMINANKSKKVIFIDDLDRCSKEKVIETLETIKTFLDVESCIFLIACDDNIIKQAICKSNDIYASLEANEGEEYLKKFFQYSISVPPFLIPDMRSFVKEIIIREKNDLLNVDDNVLDDIIFILINEKVKSPRNAISILNSFNSALKVALLRESSKTSKVHIGSVSKNLHMLAIFVALKENYDFFYSDILKNNDLFNIVLESIETTIDYEEQTDEINELLKNYFLPDDNGDIDKPKNNRVKELLLFLESIKSFVNSDLIMPYLYLEVDSYSYNIGEKNMGDINRSLKNGLDSNFKSIINEADDDRIIKIFKHSEFCIDHIFKGTEKRKAIQIIANNIRSCPEIALYSTCQMFYRFFDIDHMSKNKVYLDILLTCLDVLRDHQKEGILKSLLRMLGRFENDFDLRILKGLYLRLNLIARYPKLLVKLSNFIFEQLTNYEQKDKNYISFDQLKHFLDSDKSKLIINEDTINYVVEVLIYNDNLKSTENENEYYILEECFELIFKNIIYNNYSLQASLFEKLLVTNFYFEQLLNNLDKPNTFIDKIYAEQFLIQVIKRIESDNEINNIDKLFMIFNRNMLLNDNLISDNLFSQIVDTFEIVITKDAECIDKYLSNLLVFLMDYNDIQNITNIIFENLNLENDQQYITLLKFIFKIIDKVDLSIHDELVIYISSILSNIIIYQSDDLLNLIEKIIKEKLVNINNLNLDGIVNQEIESLVYNNDDIAEKIVNDYINIINLVFNKLSNDGQDEFLETLISIMKEDIENFSFILSFILKISDNILNKEFINEHKNYLFRNIEYLNNDVILDLFRLIDRIGFFEEDDLPYLIHLKHNDSDVSFIIKLIIDNWDLMDFDIINELIVNMKSNMTEELAKKISNRILESAYIEDELTNLEELYCEDNFSRTNFFYIVKELALLLDIKQKKELISIKIEEIKNSENIDLCRNKFTIINCFKDNSFEKNNDVNDLIFILFNDSIDKKKLAVDIFHFYYEGRIPYKRKMSLTETLTNMINELDHNYKEKIYKLGKLYNLKIRKSVLQELEELFTR